MTDERLDTLAALMDDAAIAQSFSELDPSASAMVAGKEPCTPFGTT